MKTKKSVLAMAAALIIIVGAIALAACETKEPADAKYSVTIESVQNGTITADKSSAKEGESVTLTVSPAENYRLKEGSLKVDGTTLNGFTFTMPKKDVTVTGEFEIFVSLKNAFSVFKNNSFDFKAQNTGILDIAVLPNAGTHFQTSYPEVDGVEYEERMEIYFWEQDEEYFAHQKRIDVTQDTILEQFKLKLTKSEFDYLFMGNEMQYAPALMMLSVENFESYFNEESGNFSVISDQKETLMEAMYNTKYVKDQLLFMFGEVSGDGVSFEHAKSFLLEDLANGVYRFSGDVLHFQFGETEITMKVRNTALVIPEEILNAEIDQDMTQP